MLLKENTDLDLNKKPLHFTDLNINDPKDNEILIKVTVCGVCHTELDQIEGRIKPSFLPVVLGHQIIGNVFKTGPKTTKFSTGDRVGVAWINSVCGKCSYCQSGMENLCSNFNATGKNSNGGYAEYHLADENFIFNIPESLDDISAAPLLCAGSIGYRSLTLTGAVDGDSIGLMGFGASGHIVIKLIREIYPNSKVFVFSRNSNERNLALNLGAIWAGEIDEKSPENLNAIIDTTPAWKPVIESLNNLKPSGRLVINAIRKDSSDLDYFNNLDYAQHLWMEKEVKSVTNITRQDVVKFLNLADRLKIKPIVHQYSLENANDALIDLKFGNNVGAKVLVIK
ncbi:MAG: alcohol dehydrogenase catalytic domain-containing protein [Thermodesulfobacteriota bacterium]